MALRQFIFFGQDDKVLFVRTDAEQAGWQVDEYSLTCLFPYDPNRRIVQGMRIGFEDDSGILQPFEVRKVKTYEPDHYQELTCEHIAVAELTDYHTDESELDNVNPQSALSAVLDSQPSTVTLSHRWQIGTVTATATSSGDIGLGSIWQNIRNIEKNWNCYIIPRVAFNSAGITGRYLDIYPAGGTWQGLRLSIEKNTDEVGVTVDDTNVKTALYGYGGQRNDTQTYDDPSRTKITLEGYSWPDKPSGAVITGGYIEDTAATAAYGRNGQPRFGFYQNGDITDQHTLAVKTWEALQATNKPEVTIDCLIRDLYRMGYHDEPIRLHDTALVELRPTNDILQLEIVKLFVDLLDPTATRPTIGTYIPNIIYIQRQVAEQANGASGSISGRRGEETKTDDEWSEFTSGFDYSNLLIHLHAEQITRSNSILQQAGMSLDAQGVIIYANDNVNNIQSKIDVQAGRITQEVTDRSNADTQLQSSITQNAQQIALKVSKGDVATQLAVEVGNVTISGGNLKVDGYVEASSTYTGTLWGGAVSVTGNIAGGGTVSGTNASFPNGTGTFNLVDANTVDTLVLDVGTYSGVKVNGTSIGLANGINSIVKDTTLPSGQFGFTYTTFSNPTPQSVNFNIAATQFYQDAVAAAERRGIQEGESHFTPATVTLQGSAYGSITPISGSGVTPTQRSLPIASASGTHYLRYTSSLKLSHYGNATLYPSPSPSSTGYTYDWYYVDTRYGTSYYQSAGTATAYSVSDYTYYTVPSSYANTTLYKAGNAVTNLRYPGTPDSSTYYTYNPT